MKIRLMLLLMATSILLSCKKDERTVEEQPLAGYLKETNFTEEVALFDDNRPIEMGMRFKVLKPGHIKALTLRLPFERSDVRISLWDADQQTLLKSFTVAKAAAATEVVLPIAAYALAVGKGYTLSMRTTASYVRYKKDMTAATHPVVVGHISFSGFSWKYAETATLSYPDILQLDQYGGYLSFVFETKK